MLASKRSGNELAVVEAFLKEKLDTSINYIVKFWHMDAADAMKFFVAFSGLARMDIKDLITCKKQTWRT